MVFGLILVAIGIFALLVATGVLSGSLWSYAWPTILIIIGLAILFRRRSRIGWRGCCGPGREEEKK